MRETPKFTTPEPDLILYSELTSAEIRQVQRRIKRGELSRVAAGIATARPASEWPTLVRRELIRLLASLYPGAVIGPRSAFAGGGPDGGIMYLTADFSDGDRSFQIYRDRSRWVFEGCLIVHAAVTPLYLFQ